MVLNINNVIYVANKIIETELPEGGSCQKIYFKNGLYLKFEKRSDGSVKYFLLENEISDFDYFEYFKSNDLI